MINLMRLMALTVVAVVGVAACSSSTSGPGASSSSTGAAQGPAVPANTISIKNFAFSPTTLTVKPGTKVTVTNQDTTTHTVTAQPQPTFDTGDIAPGKTATFTAPTKPGSYAYICSIHTFMKGTLVVK
jgi:plastocyanin